MEKAVILRKLLVEKSSSFLLMNVPIDLDTVFEGLNTKANNGSPDFVILFAYTLEELSTLMRKSAHTWEKDPIFWACYPKGSSKLKGDIKRDTLVRTFEKFGAKPVTQISIDNTWTAMRLRPHDRVGKNRLSPK